MGRVHKRTTNDIKEILEGNKKFEEVDHLHFSSGNWTELLLGADDAQFAEFQNPAVFQGLLADDCCKIMLKRPEMRAYFQAWNELSGANWLALIRNDKDYYGSQCSAYCSWSKFHKEQIVELLKHYPEFADRVGLHRLLAENWRELLLCHPEVLSSFRKSNLWQTFRYDRFIAAVRTAEILEQETGQNFVRYADWEQFNLDDWKKFKGRDEVFFKKYYPRIVLPDNLPGAAEMVAAQPEESRYAWELWKCRRLREQEKDRVLHCLAEHPGLRSIKPLYEMIRTQFELTKCRGVLLYHEEQRRNHNHFIKTYSETCPDIIRIIQGECVTWKRKSTAKKKDDDSASE